MTKTKIAKTHSKMFRKETYSIEEVLSKRVPRGTPNDQIRVDFDGDLVKMNSQRYELFDLKGVCCVECGIEGKYFVKEKSQGVKVYHFNLYAVDEEGEEVLMTKDHIVPRSKGGKNHLSNYQTMCKICNEKKADQLIVS